jgi:hypothetical protein
MIPRACRQAKEHSMITATVKFRNGWEGFGFIQPDGSRRSASGDSHV